MMLLKLSMAAGLLVGQAVSANPVKEQRSNQPVEPLFSMNPNLIPLQQNADTENLFPMADCNGFKLEEATFTEMQDAMKAGKLTSVQLVTCYLIRTEQTQNYIK